VKTVAVTKPVKDIKTRLTTDLSKQDEEERRMVLNFVDLLEKCLQLGADKRLTPREALSHPFILVQ
jgi:serine/threonine-protein kinase PRP4